MKPLKRRFEWDASKSRLNKAKHGFGFELASRVFDDALAVSDYEGREHGEDRWRVTGQIGAALVVVSFTSWEEGGSEIVRIISARKATPKERQKFEESG